ncbi:MAG: glyoxalase/bleomycin resistance/dioxygenase family protein [Burkholderiaceae bacterium]|jgi:catechol 2,3-dioxygenase-like lactoylglutathione lyase family enzyme|uniref:ArsI/CadI family heavy metal resistance metalloenzyme n=1 Tax=Polynucleobacter sp. MWH-Loch1C5 TaxID=2689108 RepID=UPI001C0CFF10|nr:ArsI/CadI family heavy metal resistance metalloenzyme [Polynucleobacter sp. MWH-Loch1C5]MBU3542942.1 glyoxalase/bleomycin resistance/dioxygenase family protein [Polynucleobacter sp. MWH-Loch1C5]NBV00994.1 glyoxalase/bleomycin resistance/dioxygenase family protein [Burkholderiaceae bacterium]
MKRMHIHIAVTDLDASINFYSKMFAQDPTIRKADYAKWQLDNPRINFAISARGAKEGLNHLGIQVEDNAELVEMKARLDSLQGELIEEQGAACCYAQSDKYWVNDPSGIAWETFHTLDSIPVFNTSGDDASCCVPQPTAVGVSIANIQKKSCN